MACFHRGQLGGRSSEEERGKKGTHGEHDGSDQSAEKGAPHGFDGEVDGHFLWS